MLQFSSVISVICVILIKLMVTNGHKSMDGGYHIDVINGSYSKNITVTVSSDRESIIHFEDSVSYLPYTVFAWSYDVDPSFPIFIMVRQQKEATSWEIPLLVQSKEGILSFHRTSRTLCHNNIDSITQKLGSKSHTNDHDRGVHKRLSMSVSTAYDIPTNVTIRVEEQLDFYLKENENYSVTISPSEPRFFYYKFPNKNDTDSRGTVILEVESADDTCFTVSIQQATCPVFDLNQDISYEGEYETINTKGGIIIKEADFPNGFFIVLVAKGDNFDCDKKNSVIPMQKIHDIKPSNHSSVVMFKIKPNLSYDTYILATISTLAGFLIFYVVFWGIYCEFCSSGRRDIAANENGYQNLSNVEDDSGHSNSSPSITKMGIRPELNSSKAIKSQISGVTTEINNFPSSSKGKNDGEQNTIMNVNEGECSVQDSFDQIEVTRENNPGESTIEVEIHPNINSRKDVQGQASGSRPYTKNGLDGSGSTLYQSVIEEYEKVTNAEPYIANEIINKLSEEPSDPNVLENNIFGGIDQKLLCSQLYLSDLAKREPNNIHQESINYFLQVISIGIFYGIPVVQLVITHQRMVNETGNLDTCYYNFLCAHPFMGLSDYNHVLSNMGYILLGILFLVITRLHRKMPHHDNCGIPQHYGLYYAMGTALIMEGILSACYHVCPNQSNFQFDTSFMYVMAVLCIIKLYQNRHPDVNATAYVTFLILAIAVLIAMVGILNGHILVWTGFIILYSFLCLYIAVKIYYVNDVKGGWTLVYRTTRKIGMLQIFIPRKKDRCLSVLAVTVLNIILVHLGYVCYVHNVDFATFLLGLLMTNVIIYTIIYVFMKIKHKETLCIQSVLYLIVAGTLWGFALYFFINNSTQWMGTPAESRQWNTECVIFNFYDYHDIWHLLSATALFFSFMLLLTLDNQLVNEPHQEIPVF